MTHDDVLKLAMERPDLVPVLVFICQNESTDWWSPVTQEDLDELERRGIIRGYGIEHTN